MSDCSSYIPPTVAVDVALEKGIPVLGPRVILELSMNVLSCIGESAIPASPAHLNQSLTRFRPLLNSRFLGAFSFFAAYIIAHIAGLYSLL